MLDGFTVHLFLVTACCSAVLGDARQRAVVCGGGVWLVVWGGAVVRVQPSTRAHERVAVRATITRRIPRLRVVLALSDDFVLSL
ncbi:hypothetical protein [Sanguibacter antarcticus]|uniref:hypothetical protein n=1 Tax=Sanguibacter antarcticus TaxID=372484 RepID=UPI000BF3D0EA|nr:hypothetical protein [Sanguibacter antarcticus]